MTSPDFVQRTLSIWLDKYPENTTYEVDHVLKHRHPAQSSNKPTRQKAAVQFRKIGDPPMFALIGATFTPEDTDHLLIQVMVSKVDQSTIHGLLLEFAHEVFSTAVIQAYIQSGEITSLGPGTLTFDCAQTHPIDSTAFCLMATTKYVLRQLTMPELTTEEEVFEYLRTNQDPPENSDQFISGLSEAIEQEIPSIKRKAISKLQKIKTPAAQELLTRWNLNEIVD